MFFPRSPAGIPIVLVSGKRFLEKGKNTTANDHPRERSSRISGGAACSMLIAGIYLVMKDLFLEDKQWTFLSWEDPVYRIDDPPLFDTDLKDRVMNNY